MTTITVASEKDTEALGRALGPLLKIGDCVTLSGALGAGKTSLARALIRTRAGAPVDVPSPSYTLVEAYEFETPIFHVDLYRLGAPDEVVELGLEDLFEAGIVLIEWPDRAKGLLPQARLDIRIDQGEGEERMIRLEAGSDEWRRRIEPLAISWRRS